jgi:hypothetical protein
MPPTDAPIRSTDPDDVIEANIDAAREQNERERYEVTEAPKGPPPIRATEVPRETEHRGDRIDTTPVGYWRSPEDRGRVESEVAMGPYVGPIDGDGRSIDEQEEIMAESATGGRRDRDGNLLYDPGIGPGHRPTLGGVRDDDGNLVADHDGDGIASAKEGPIREAIGAGVAPEASEEEQHGSRSEQDPDRDLDAAADEAEAEEAPTSDLSYGGAEPDTEPEVIGEPDDAVRSDAPQPPGEDASAEDWRQFARDNGVEVSATANKAITKSALRDAGLLR